MSPFQLPLIMRAVVMVSLFGVAGWAFEKDYHYITIPSYYFAVALLYQICPAPVVDGYAKDASGHPFKYRLSGFRTLLITTTLFFFSSYASVIDPTRLLTSYFSLALVSSHLGIIISILFFLWGPWPGGVCAPKLSDSLPSSKSGLFNSIRFFFFGFELSPQFGGFDFKMFLYVIGAVCISNTLIASIWSSSSPAVQVYCFLMFWFILEYTFFEQVHLYTYDLIDENVGFKLIWGCFCFFPWFYTVGIFPLLQAEHSPSTPQLLIAFILYCFGSFLTRGSNLQKYHFKLNPKATFLGIRPVIIGGRILVSGWWGVARHVNYLGEILQAFALALPSGLCSPLPWLYPLYYLVLFIARERDDDLRCEKKYGRLWEEYRLRVPYRIVPGIY